MFCKNCGANLPEGASFCGSCGSQQEAPVQNPVPPAQNSGYSQETSGGYNNQPHNYSQEASGDYSNQSYDYSQETSGGYNNQSQRYSTQLSLNSFSIGALSGMRLIAFIAMALVAIFSITEFMYMEVGGNGGSYDYSFNFMEIFDGNLLKGEVATGYKVLMYLILFSNIVTLLACAGYIVFSFMGGQYANSPMAIQKCSICATVALVALVAGLIFCFICPSPMPEEANAFLSRSQVNIDFGYGVLGWFSIIIVAAVRFYALPVCMKDANKAGYQQY